MKIKDPSPTSPHLPSLARYKLEDRRLRLSVQLGDRQGYHEALVQLREALGQATALGEDRRGELLKVGKGRGHT